MSHASFVCHPINGAFNKKVFPKLNRKSRSSLWERSFHKQGGKSSVDVVFNKSPTGKKTINFICERWEKHCFIKIVV